MDVLTKMQDVNKKYGSVIVFSKSTLNAISQKVSVSYRYIGNIQIETNGEQIPIFESLLPYARQKREKLEKFRTEFEHGVRNYNNAKFEQAKDIFEQVYKHEKDDKVCYVYYNKSVEKLSSPAIK